MKDQATTIEMVAIEAARVSKPKIDGNIIRGVHLVGLQAKNIVKPNETPYTYKEVALQEAVQAGIYNEIDVFVGHVIPEDGKPLQPRNPSDKIGYTSNITYKASEGVFGDLVLNPKHQAYEAFMWWAVNKPEKLALSQVAKTIYDVRENAMTKIIKANSLDIVSEGSTTHTGLFHEGILADEIMSEKWLRIILDQFDVERGEVMYPMYCGDKSQLTQQEKAIKLLPAVKDLLEEVTKIATTKQAADPDNDGPAGVDNETEESLKDKNMDIKAITLEMLKTDRKDLVDAIAADAVKAHVAIEAAIEKALEPIAKDSRSATFTKLVREAVIANDDKLVQELVNDRKSLTSKTDVTPTTTVIEAAPAPVSKIVKQETETKKPLSIAEIATLVNKR